MNVPVFDGHNDLLLRLHRGGTVAAFLDGDSEGQLDLPRALEGGLAGGMFAMFVPSEDQAGGPPPNELMRAPSYDVPVAPPLAQASAEREVRAMVEILHQVERQSAGRVRICRGVADIRDCMARGVLAAVLHLEGAEAIDDDLALLDELERAGLRSIGPVWSRSSRFGEGVPFRFPSSPDTGPGLTDLGRRLVRECNRRRIVVDVSHLTERGFWEVAEVSDTPLVASHSNAHAVCAHSRNLTDRQLDAIRERRGLVGLNFACTFLRADGRLDTDTPFDQMMRHLDHLIARVGEDGVGFGSDFDGATIPQALGDVAGLPRLVSAMRVHGFGSELVEKLCWRNWLGVLERTWGEV